MHTILCVDVICICMILCPFTLKERTQDWSCQYNSIPNACLASCCGSGKVCLVLCLLTEILSLIRRHELTVLQSFMKPIRNNSHNYILILHSNIVLCSLLTL